VAASENDGGDGVVREGEELAAVLGDESNGFL
jgi:hypothetical protein